eukprot:5681414-Ditylum_brightwellii.AAC.1
MEKELLSIMETTEFHRNILLCFKLRFDSDHKNLSFENFCSKSNVVADMLSWYPSVSLSSSSIAEMNVLEDKADFPVEYRTIQKSQLANKTTDTKDPKDWTVV